MIFPEKFNIFRNDRKEKPNDPDYFIVGFSHDGGTGERVGACWLKEGKGGKFLSCSQSNKLTPPAGARPVGEDPLSDQFI